MGNYFRSAASVTRYLVTAKALCVSKDLHIHPAVLSHTAALLRTTLSLSLGLFFATSAAVLCDLSG